MKRTNLILLLVFVVGLFPWRPVQAESESPRPIDDAIAFMYISDALLTPDEEIDDSDDGGGINAIIFSNPKSVSTDPILARIIHAKKMQRNDLDANCKLLDSIYRSQGKDCEADKIKNHCAKKREEYNAQIAFYRKMRGDKRKLFTRFWHSIKRAGANFWRRIGPLGRNFLRNVGEEAFQMALTGGLSKSALKNLIKHHAKTMGRKRIKQIVFQGVQRLMQGQIDIAQAAGVDICDENEEDQENTETSAEVEIEMSQSENEIKLPKSGVWSLTCQHTWQPVLDDYGNPDWVVDIDWESRTFFGNIQAMSKEVDGIETLIWTWNETGSGTITDDGFFWGDFHNDSILSVQYGENEPIINDYGYDQKWIGAIEPDLSRICFYRVGAQEWFTLDWIRERGRQEMLKEGSGLCEAYCMGQ